MNKILAAIDGSTYAESVCDHVAWFASRTGFAVELLHVINRKANPNADHDLSGSIGLGARTALLDELSELDKRRAKIAKEHGRALLQDAKDRLMLAGIENVSTTMRHDELSDSVAELEKDVNVIMLGKRGMSADFSSLHLGSNLERVARSSQKPLIVASRAFKPINKALIAFDGGRSSNRAIDELIRYTGFTDVQVELLFVGSPSDTMGKLLEEACSKLGKAGYQASSSMAGGTPEKNIADYVEKNNIDMLLMGAYGHSRIRNLLIGSTTTEMLRTCLVPVMLFR